MLDIHDFGLFAASALLLNLTPGPDTLYVASHAAARGWRGGAVAALGIGAGCSAHILAATVGLSALLVASSAAFAALKWAGSGYLVWIGLGLLFRRPEATTAPPARTGYRRIWAGAALTNALNPKVALFFLAFLPQFVAADGRHRAASFLVLGLLFALSGTLWLLAVAALTARAAGRPGRPRWAGPLLGRLTGVVFVAFGVRLALAARG